MSYAIIRMQKLKAPAIRGIQFHNQRERESETNPDIEKEKSNLNYDLWNAENIDYVEAVNNRIEEAIESNKKVRKDAVRLCEFLVTSDKEFFDKLSPVDEKKFFIDAVDYLKDKYGEDNVLYATVHKDEKTPHMHVGIVPITEDNRLAAKSLFTKQSLVKLQDEFHKHMNQVGFELERGVSSDKKHIKTAKLKADTLNNSIKDLDQQKGKLVDEITNKNFEIKGIQRDLTLLKVDIKDKKSELQDSLKKLEELQKEVAKIETPITNLESIKESRFLKKVTVGEADYDMLKNMAKKSLVNDKEKEMLQSEVEKLKGERNQYKKSYEHMDAMSNKYFKENQELKRENKQLTQERNRFKKLYELVLRFLKEKYPQIHRGIEAVLGSKEKELINVKEKENELER